MAHQSLIATVAASAAVAFGAVACGGAPEAVNAPVAAAAAPRPAAFPQEEARWPQFHSVRFRLSIPLPDGRAWRIDDHAQPELHAVHEATGSRLVVYAWSSHELMNRARCEEAARARGLVPDGLETVEESVAAAPEGYDTRIWVALNPGKDAEAPLRGHVFAFGASIRRCLFVDFQTEVPTAKDEETLSGRLALVKIRVLGGIKLDPPRTTPDAEIPTQKR